MHSGYTPILHAEKLPPLSRLGRNSLNLTLDFTGIIRTMTAGYCQAFSALSLFALNLNAHYNRFANRLPACGMNSSAPHPAAGPKSHPNCVDIGISLSYTPCEAGHFRGVGVIHMSMKLCLFACAVIVAAVFLYGCQAVSRLEEPPSLLKVESTTVPAPEGTVIPPEKKTAICPDCAARMKGGVKSSVVYRSAEVPALADIYFNYDKYAITPAAAGILRSNARWFRANPRVKVRLEGHCDERGTGKYNVRLGQQRAKAAKSYLMRLGVSGRVLEVSTYGSEKPDSSEHNTQAWARNRKVHFAPLE